MRKKSPNICKNILLSWCSLLAYAASYETALAQVNEGTSTVASGVPGLEEIVVTAQKRTELLSQVPIAATALGQDDLIQLGLTKLTDLSEVVPGLHIADTASIGGPEITLRGIGAASFQQNSDATVADPALEK